ncbi:replication-relaxation family protein [Streptomyces acidiscabies]|uniref:Replication-relaxation family protein n=1 Tax=Streptomyces acidiscabies TaxID=42234 RepID=A0ABU4MBW0_9ACTN|nr:replication-relaxation family protein [Streptomyces acidiscabies]MDX3025398.1 replication-relaxation family protein [Streptomyces acidiscabies]
MLALSCVRIATADQLSMVVTDNRVGVGYTLRALRDLEALGLVGHGRHGRSKVWHLTTSGQRAVAEGGDVPVRPHAATGERAIAAGLAAHGLGVTDVMIAFGGHLLDWEVEVDHSIDKVRRVVTDAVLRRDSHGAEVELLEFDRGTMSVARLAAKLRTYQAYSQATFHEGERGTIGTTKYVWRERYRRSRYFPVIRLVLDGGDKATLERRTEALRQQVRGIQLRVVVAPLKMLQKPGDEWAWEPIGIDDDEARQVA